MPEEPYLDNPAGRLHYVLQRFGSHRESQIIGGWNSALGVEPPKVPRALIGVSDLIAETKQAFSDSGMPMFPELPERLDEIDAMLFQHAQPMTAAVNSILPTNWDYTLDNVRNLSRYLHHHGTHSNVPDFAEVAELVKATRELIAAVTDSDVLPPEVKVLLLQQLAQVLSTLEEVRIYGPEKVRRELLAVAATVYASEPKLAANHPAKKVRSTLDPILHWLAVVAASVAIVGDTGAAALTWEHVFQGQIEATTTHVDVTIEQPERRALPAETGTDGHTPAEGAPRG